MKRIGAVPLLLPKSTPKKKSSSFDIKPVLIVGTLIFVGYAYVLGRGGL